MAFVVHPKYKPLREVLSNQLLETAASFFRGQYEREMADELSSAQFAELSRRLGDRALGATRDYVKITTDYRGNISKRNRRALKKRGHGSHPSRLG
jgi:hypothetical protein